MPARRRRAAARLAACPAGGDLLDVPCGYGRHSIPLARAGYRVMGVDRSPTLLAEARRRAGEEPARARRGRLPRAAVRRRVLRRGTEPLHLAGLLGDEEDVKVLERDRPGPAPERAPRDRDHAPRPRSCSGFREQDWRLLGEGRLLLEQRTFDAAAGIAQTTQTLIDKDGGRDSRTFSVRALHRDRARGHAARAGFADVRCYGDLEGGPFEHDDATRHRRPALTPASAQEVGQLLAHHRVAGARRPVGRR